MGYVVICYIGANGLPVAVSAANPLPAASVSA